MIFIQMGVTFDSNTENLSFRRLDSESMIKTSQFFLIREKNEILKTQGKNIFVSPNFSRLIRIFSENSFEAISLIFKLIYPCKKFQEKFIGALLILGFGFLSIFIQCNVGSLRLVKDKKSKFIHLFYLSDYGIEKIVTNHKISVAKIQSMEFLAVSKGIIIESIGVTYQNYPEIFWLALRFLLVFYKILDSSRLKYNWGIYFLNSFDNFENNLKSTSLSSFVFLYKSGTNNYPKQWKIGLYDEFLFAKSLLYSERSSFCVFYHRKVKLGYLIKSNHMANQKTFISGCLESDNCLNRTHLFPLDSFCFKIIDKNDCLGEISKAKNENKLFYWKLSDLKILKYQKHRNCDFLCQKKIFRFNSEQKISSLKFQRKLACFYTKKKSIPPFSTLRLNYLTTFFINISILKYYAPFILARNLYQFINEFNMYSFLNLNEVCSIMYFFKLNKQNTSPQENEMWKIQGSKLETFFELTFGKLKKNVIFNQFWNPNCIFLLHSFYFYKKSLSECYRKFSLFKQSRLILKTIKSKKIFLANLFFIENKKTLEIKIRKYNDLFDFENNCDFISVLGNITKQNKYFEIIWENFQKQGSFAKQSLGLWFCEQEEWAHAKKQFLLSITLNPKNKNVWFDLGFVSLKIKDFSSATRSFLKIVQEEPWNNYAWSNLISIFCSKIGKKKGIFFFLKEAMKIRKFPFFVFKKFSIFCLGPKNLKVIDILEKFKTSSQKIFDKKYNYIILYLKVSFVLLELYSKKSLLLQFQKFKKIFYLQYFSKLFGFKSFFPKNKFLIYRQIGSFKFHIFEPVIIDNSIELLIEDKRSSRIRFYKKINQKLEIFGYILMLLKKKFI